ncbi:MULTISPECIES: single-stranded DNA-binding protein [Leucobacter]|uniref:Single-stranded DNA-binding protein n=2 Tax=Leucobacter TaxID=55968 RepID=A0A4Q7U454_9MICO|nr:MULTISPECIES: single-stranded DNA-binding protein [Leucobacter]MBL3691075.1 single-stranded DNA-binding protein [Leucobacter chromiireducens subsp. chromiireducens]MBL3700848.1 single-stranded DNA-binding protein [Leucobacter luti]RZT68313.1 hypothetical protein EV139_0035 [Leucobacter luti]
MELRTKTALTGYLSRTPQLKRLPDGLGLFIGQLGQKQYRDEADGSLTLLGTNYIKLVLLGENAEEAFADFVEGDDVVAIGGFKTRSYEHRAQKVEEREFQAVKLLFDTTRARYQVERKPRRRMEVAREQLPISAAVESRAAQPASAQALGR